jgi:hypothetical protein
MAYTVYSGKLIRTATPEVSISPDGRLRLNSAACRLFHDKGAKWVHLLSDPQERKIGLRARRKMDKQSYSISYGHLFNQASLSVKGFLVTLGWDGKSYSHIDAQWDDEQCLLELKMPQWGIGADRENTVLGGTNQQIAG